MLKSTDVIKNKDYPVYRNIKKIKIIFTVAATATVMIGMQPLAASANVKYVEQHGFALEGQSLYEEEEKEQFEEEEDSRIAEEEESEWEEIRRRENEERERLEEEEQRREEEEEERIEREEYKKKEEERKIRAEKEKKKEEERKIRAEKEKKKEEAERKKEEERIKKEEDKKRKEIAEKKKQIKAFAARLVKNAKTDKEKIKAFHDGICNYGSYDWQGYKEGYASSFSEDDMDNSILNNAMIMLKNKKGVCGHYASLFTECCRAYGINSEVVMGDNHAWSNVTLGNKKYVVDVTLDDDDYKKKIKYNYFMIKEHPKVRAMKIREQYAKDNKIPQYRKEFAKIDRNNIKTQAEFLKALSNAVHTALNGNKVYKFQFKITGKNFNMSNNFNAFYMLGLPCRFSWKNNTYTLEF